MVLQENINVVRKLFDLYNKNDVNGLNQFDGCFSPHVKFHDPANATLKGTLNTIKQAEWNYIQAFPDKVIHVESLLPVDDKVVVRWRCEGTHKGSFQNRAATNNPIHVSGISIYTLANGKITEVWQVWDRFALYEELHAVPTWQAKAA